MLLVNRISSQLNDVNRKVDEIRRRQQQEGSLKVAQKKVADEDKKKNESIEDLDELKPAMLSADEAVEMEHEDLLYDDELANESANVSEKNNAESANGASIHQAVSSSISQNKAASVSQQFGNPKHEESKSSINKISSSGFHQRNSMNEHDMSLSSNSKNSVQPARKSNLTKPTKNNSPLMQKRAHGQIINESTLRNKLKLFPQKQEHVSRFQSARHASSSLSRLQQQTSTGLGGYGASQGLKNNSIFVTNLVKQLEQTRKQLEMKERQMQQLNLYVQEVIKENSQLNMRLQLEERNNQMLMHQLNQYRMINYRDDGLQLFEQQRSYARQPRKPSGKIHQKLNQKDITFDNNSDGGLGAQRPEIFDQEESLPFGYEEGKDQTDSPRFNESSSQEAQILKKPELMKPEPKEGGKEQDELEEAKIEVEEADTPKKQKSEESVIKPTDRSRRRYVDNDESIKIQFNLVVPANDENILQSIPSGSNTQRKTNVNSENESGVGLVNIPKQRLLDVNFSEKGSPIDQEQNSIILSPPNEVLNNQLYQAQQVNSFMPPTRASQGLKPKKSNNKPQINQRQDPKSDFSFDEKQEELSQTGSREDYGDEYEEQKSQLIPDNSIISKFEHLVDQVKINKVNEMDIKVSRFEKNQNSAESLMPLLSARLEEIIPNEEPLIQIRKFSGSGAASTLNQVQENQQNLNLIQRQLNQRIELAQQSRQAQVNNLTGLGSVFDSFSHNLDERMNDYEHQGIHITNYPQVNLNRAGSSIHRIQGAAHAPNTRASEVESIMTSQPDLVDVLNRNVFNNSRRITNKANNMQVQHLKPQFIHKNIRRQPILEEEEKGGEDLDQASQDDVEQSFKIKPKSSLDQHYIQQQLYLSEQSQGQPQRQLPLNNFNGDKGNNLIEEEEESKTSKKSDRMQHMEGDDHGPDCLDILDNIDVNIDETFSAKQQALYIQNFSNLGNLSQLRFQRGVGSQNRSGRQRNIFPQQNNFMFSALGDQNQHSFSQLSQLGENLAESKDYDSEINQIRISNRNFPNHAQMLRHNGFARRQNYDQLNPPMFGNSLQINQVQINDENPQNSSRYEDIARERRQIIPELNIPQITNMQRVRQHNRQQQSRGHDQSIGNNPVDNEDLIDEQEHVASIGGQIHTQRHLIGMPSQMMHFGQHQQYRLQNRNQERHGVVRQQQQEQQAENLRLSNQNSSANQNRRDTHQMHQGRTSSRQVNGPPSQARGQLIGIAGPAIRGEGMLQFDDMGLDEYDVADERQHEIGFDRWEINLDQMSYEELIALQARIGYVNKGLDLNQIKSFPQMKKAELQQMLKQQRQGGNKSLQVQQSVNFINLNESRYSDVLEDNQSLKFSNAPYFAEHNGINFINDEQGASRKIMKPQLKIQAELRAAQIKSDLRSMQNNSFHLDIEDFLGGNDLVVQPLRVQRQHQNFISAHRLQEPPIQNQLQPQQVPQPRQIIVDIQSAMSMQQDNDQQSLISSHRQRMLAQQILEESKQQQMYHTIRQNDYSRNRQLLQQQSQQHFPEQLLLKVPQQPNASFRSERKQNLAFSMHDEMEDQEDLNFRYRHQSLNLSKQGSQVSRESHHSSQIKIDDCAICFENISDSQIIKVLEPCNHYFHNDCINQWLIIENKCPMCMQCLVKDKKPEEIKERPVSQPAREIHNNRPRQVELPNNNE